MAELLLILVCLALLVVGSGTDFKWNEVPDWLNFAGIASGLGIRAIMAGVQLDWTPLLQGIYGFGAMFLLSCFLFYLGQWGGGDSKLLMAMGALLGLELSWDNLLLAFLVFAVVAGAFYGLFWSFWLAFRNWKKVRPQWKKVLSATRQYQVLTWVLAGAVAVLGFFFKDFFLFVCVFVLAIMFPLLLYAALFTKTIERACMLKYVSPGKLVEGDWIAKKIVVNGRRIAGPKDLGISKMQIAELKRKKVKKVLVKNGIPFVPALLIAFVCALVFGNILKYLLA